MNLKDLKKNATKKAAKKGKAKAPSNSLRVNQIHFHNNRLRVLRTMHGLNTIELAKKLKTTKQSISDAERMRTPSDAFLIKICDYFKVPLEFFTAEQVTIKYKGDKFSIEVGKK